jgi:hypothetical protein
MVTVTEVPLIGVVNALVPITSSISLAVSGRIDDAGFSDVGSFEADA